MAESKVAPSFFLILGRLLILALLCSPCVTANVTDEVVEAEPRLLDWWRGDATKFLEP